MKTGMLWLDDDKNRSLEDKVIRAVDYYCEKYGKTPELCFVNPSMLEEESKKIGRVEVRPFSNVQPHHFWLGVQQS